MSFLDYDASIDRVRSYNPDYDIDDYGTLYTDAFWKLQYEFLLSRIDSKNDCGFKIEASYIDEIVACLLGGFGFKAEIGWAAFQRLKSSNLIRRGIEYENVAEALSEPIKVGNSLIRYRFPFQKAKYVSEFLNRKDLDNAPLYSDLSFRSWLLTINGIGPKTASWITRNCFRSDNVAIIDIHLYRAGVLTGFVNPNLDIQKDYFEIEKQFLNYCHQLNVKPSIMDMVMWMNMKSTNKIAISLIQKINCYGRF